MNQSKTPTKHAPIKWTNHELLLSSHTLPVKGFVHYTLCPPETYILLCVFVHLNYDLSFKGNAQQIGLRVSFLQCFPTCFVHHYSALSIDTVSTRYVYLVLNSFPHQNCFDHHYCALSTKTMTTRYLYLALKLFPRHNCALSPIIVLCPSHYNHQIPVSCPCFPAVIVLCPPLLCCVHQRCDHQIPVSCPYSVLPIITMLCPPLLCCVHQRYDHPSVVDWAQSTN